MPAGLHLIEGIVKDLEGNKIDGVTVTFNNQTTTGSTALTDTSGSDPETPGTGEYSQNIGDFTEGWSDGDVVELTASLSGIFKTTVKNVTVDQKNGNAGVDLIMVGEDPREDDLNATSTADMGLLMSVKRKTFWRGVDDEDAYSLTTSFAAQTGADQFLELNSNEVAYITDIFVGGDGLTDGVIVYLAKNSLSDGTGDSLRVTRDLVGNGDEMGRHYHLQCPIRVEYESGVAQSIVMFIAGTGTSDDAVCSFRGFIMNK